VASLSAACPIDAALATAEAALTAQCAERVRARSMSRNLSSTHSHSGAGSATDAAAAPSIHSATAKAAGSAGGAAGGGQRKLHHDGIDEISHLLNATRAELQILAASGMSGKTLSPIQLRLMAKLQAEERRLLTEQQKQLAAAAAAGRPARRSAPASTGGPSGSTGGAAASGASPFHTAAARLGLGPLLAAAKPVPQPVPEDEELYGESSSAAASPELVADGGDGTTRSAAAAAAAWLVSQPRRRSSVGSGLTGQQLLAAYRAVSLSESEIAAAVEAEGAAAPGSTNTGMALDDMLRAYTALASKGRSSPDRAAALAALMASARSSAAGVARTATMDSTDLLFDDHGELLNVPLHLLGAPGLPMSAGGGQHASTGGQQQAGASPSRPEGISRSAVAAAAAALETMAASTEQQRGSPQRRGMSQAAEAALAAAAAAAAAQQRTAAQAANESPAAAVSGLVEAGRIDNGLRLNGTATGKAVLQFAGRPGATVASARRALCVGALVDATKQLSTPASPAVRDLSPVRAIHASQHSKTPGSPNRRAKTPSSSRPGSGWLCFGSPRVRGDDEAAQQEREEQQQRAAAAAAAANAAAAAAAEEVDQGPLRFLIGPAGGLHVASSAPEARVERVVLAAGMWVPVGAQLEVVTAGGERHAVMVPDECEWAKLIAGLNAALLLADGAEWMQGTPVMEMVWSSRVEGILS